MYVFQIQNGLFYWKDEYEGFFYDIFYCLEKVVFICWNGLYSGEFVLYSIYFNIGFLVGICLQDDFWLFVNYEFNWSNVCYIGEFYLCEILDCFRKVVFVVDFKEKFYFWIQEMIGGLYCIVFFKGYYLYIINYLFIIYVVCMDFYLLEGYSRVFNQFIFFKLEI